MSADYARVAGLSLTTGRHLQLGDTADAPAVLLINDTARRLFFPTQDPLGQQIAFWGTPRTIVGVVADERIHGLAQAAPPAAYAPLGQLPLADTLLVRTKGDPVSFEQPVRDVIREIDPALRCSVWSRSGRLFGPRWRRSDSRRRCSGCSRP